MDQQRRLPETYDGEMPYWESYGEGAPVLLFVHGFRCDRTDWLELIQRLSGRFRCVTMDLPGHGETPSGRQGTMADLGAAVNRVKSASGSRNVVFIGHSLGAKVIREAYRQQPEAVAGLILVDGSLYVSDRATMIANGRAAVAPGMEHFLRNLFSRMFFTPPPADWLEWAMRRALSGNLDYAREIFLDSIEWDLRYARATIGAIRVPALVIQATTFDETFRWQPLRRGESTGLIDTMRTQVRDFHVEIIEGAGHFVMQDSPDRTAEIIARFATRITADQTA